MDFHPRSRRNSSSTLKTDDAISKMLKRQTFADNNNNEQEDVEEFKKKKPTRDTKSINDFGKTKFFGKILDRKSKASDTASEMTADEVEEWNGTIEYNPAAVDVFLNSSMKPSCKCVFEVSNNSSIKMITAKQAIESILEQMELKENADDYDLYHFDVKYHGQRVEFQAGEYVDDLLRESYLNSVDEKWRLISKSHKEQIKVNISNDDKEMTLIYNNTMTVKEAVEKSKLFFNIPQKEVFNLFCTSLHGYWLEENKTLRTYEFTTSDKIELRTCGFQLYVRVSIPSLDAKFVLKAPLTFTGADVFRLIQYNLKVRNLNLVKPSSFYSMFLIHNNSFMDLKKCLSDYGFNEKNGDFNASQCAIELKQQTEQVTIFHDFGEPLYFLVNHEATVQDVLYLCQLEITNCNVLELELSTKSGEKLNPTALLWHILKDNEELVLQEHSKTFLFQLSIDDSPIEVDIYPSITLEQSTFILERKFGINKQHFTRFQIGSTILNRQMNFHQIKVNGDIIKVILPNSSIFGTYLTLTDENIWKSIEDTPDNIRYSLTLQEIATEIKQKDINKLECNIAAGTLNKLIEKLTATEIKDFQLYNAYLHTFLMTYHSFTNSIDLFYKLKERYHCPRQPQMMLKEFIEFRNLVQLRVGNVLKVWTKNHSFDSILTKLILDFATTVLVPDKQPQLAKQIRKCLVKNSNNINNYTFTEPSPLPKLPKKFTSNPTIFHHDPEEIARQLSITEFKLFQKIGPIEFLNQSWAKSDGEKRAPNVWLMTERFNAMASWTAKSVLEGKTIKRRSNRIEFLVELASCLLNLRNFSACMAVVAGLNSAAISRLKYSWNEVNLKSKKRKGELELALSPENAYRNYRSLLYATTDKEARIPYMYFIYLCSGVHLLDLIYVADGNPDRLDGMINFTKRVLETGVISAMLKCQEIPYNLVQVSDIQKLLRNIPLMKEDIDKELYKLSMEREPRGWDGKSQL